MDPYNVSSALHEQHIIDASGTANGMPVASITDPPTSNGERPAFPPTPNSAAEGITGSVRNDRQAQMAAVWHESSCRHWNISHTGYLRVGVLMIKWIDELDHLRCENEVDRLDSLLREQYKFETKIVTLNVAKRPQAQLDNAIAEFVLEYDDSDGRNLMIVYYTGHARWQSTTATLQFTADRMLPAARRGTHRALASWNDAEGPLSRAHTDVLAIFDTCWAGNLATKGGYERRRTYEVLTACGVDTLTTMPGANSFTEALIAALHELLKDHEGRPFTTFHLYERIARLRMHNDLRPSLFNRFKSDDGHVKIGPVAAWDHKHQGLEQIYHPSAGILSLELAIDQSDTADDLIDDFNKYLRDVLQQSPLKVHKVDWKGLRARQGRLREVIHRVSVMNRFVSKLSRLGSRRSLHSIEADGEDPSHLPLDASGDFFDPVSATSPLSSSTALATTDAVAVTDDRPLQNQEQIESPPQSACFQGVKRQRKD